MESGEHMVTLSQQLKLLADGFRKRYGKTGILTLADMTKLVTPPSFASGTVIYNTQFSLPTGGEKELTLLKVPPTLSVPMNVNVSFTAIQQDTFIWWVGGYLIFNPSSNSPIKCRLPQIFKGTQNPTIISAEIPANTIITEKKFVVSQDNSDLGSMFYITKMTITYDEMGGVINRLLSTFTSLIRGEAA